MGAERSDKCGLGAVAEADVGRNGCGLIRAEPTGSDRCDLGSDGDRGNERSVGGADLEACPPSGLPNKDRLKQPCRAGEGKGEGAGEPDVTATRHTKKPAPGGNCGDNDTGHDKPAEPADEIHVGAWRYGKTEQEDGDDVGRPQHHRGSGGGVDGRVRAFGDTQHPNRLTEAEGQHMVGAKGEMDAGERVAERQFGQHQLPCDRTQQKGDTEGCRGGHDLTGMGNRLIPGPPHELAIDGSGDNGAGKEADKHTDENNDREWQALPEQLQRVHSRQL